MTILLADEGWFWHPVAMNKKIGEIIEGGKVVVYASGSEYVTRSSVVSENQFEVYAMEGYIGSAPSLTLAVSRLRQPNTNYDHTSTPDGI